MAFFPELHYADLILPLALSKLYTYKIPEILVADLKPGQRVIVQFGKSKMYTAVVYSIHKQVPEHYDAKEILEVLDSDPVISENQFRLWEWMSEYYLCTLGEIMIAALPSIMKLQSETVVSVSPTYINDTFVLTPEEQDLVNHLNEKGSFTIADASKLTGLKNGLRLIRNMMERNILVPHEEMQDSFKSRQVSYIRMTALAKDETFMQDLFSKLEKKAPKQLHILMSFMQLKQEKERDFFSKMQFLKQTGSSASALGQLITKGVLENYQRHDWFRKAGTLSASRNCFDHPDYQSAETPFW